VEVISYLQHTLRWNSTTYNVTFSYNASNISSPTCLYVVRRGVYNDTVLTTQCWTDQSNAINYSIGNVNGTYYAEAYGYHTADSARYIIDSITFDIGRTAVQVFGAAGLFILLMGYIFALSVAFSSKVPSLFFVLPMFWTALAGFLNLVPLAISTSIGLIIVGGIVLWKSTI